MRVPQSKSSFWTLRNGNTRRTVIRVFAAVLISCIVAGIGVARFASKAQLPNRSNQLALPTNSSDAKLAMLTSVPALITTVALNAGDAFEAESVKVVSRSTETLPNDFLTSFDELHGSVALGPIPANMPVSRAMIGTAVAIIPSSLDRTSATAVDDIIYALARHTTAFDVNFTAPTRPRGTRIAIFSVLPNGEHGIITDQAWISSSQGTRAVVLVSPDVGAVLRAFKSTPLQFTSMN